MSIKKANWTQESRGYPEKLNDDLEMASTPAGYLEAFRDWVRYQYKGHNLTKEQINEKAQEEYDNWKSNPDFPKKQVTEESGYRGPL